MFRCANWLCLF